MSLRYRNDVIISIWIRHRNDMDSISKSLSFRCRIHIETITSLRCRNDMDSMSLRYLYDVESIWLQYRDDIIVTIWIRHRIHIVAMSNPYRCDVESISKR